MGIAERRDQGSALEIDPAVGGRLVAGSDRSDPFAVDEDPVGARRSRKANDLATTEQHGHCANLSNSAGSPRTRSSASAA